MASSVAVLQACSAVTTSIVAGSIYPALYQRFKVKPSEKSLEQMYIDRNIKATRTAYGIADGPAGDAVAAAVVLRSRTAATPAELSAWARTHLPVHARPRIITIVPELPRNAIGKTDRRALRDAHPG